MDYQLEIKQIVDYPRCRIYREFFRTLMADRDIRTSGSSYLFYYMTLCSYANFRSSYRRLEGISYLIEPGEWICKTSELAEWFRTRKILTGILGGIEKMEGGGTIAVIYYKEMRVVIPLAQYIFLGLFLFYYFEMPRSKTNCSVSGFQINIAIISTGSINSSSN